VQSMSGSGDSRDTSQKFQIVTDRDHTPTCHWCGTKCSKNWKYVIGTGRFYCSYNCLEAAYFRCYLSIAILSIVGLPSCLIAYFLLPIGDIRDFSLYLFYVSIVGIVGGLAYAWESKKIRSQVAKNSKSTKASVPE
jgi:hypothetical protein